MTKNSTAYFQVVWKSSSELWKADAADAFSKEEEGSLLLWAWPEIIGWPTEIEWLFSPVVGQTWPGDIWGIDENGDLLLVETKRATHAEDPMKDFVGYAEQRLVRGENPLYSTEMILERWRKRLSKERVFISKSKQSGWDQSWWNGRHPGVIPYSSKRFAIRKWPSIYIEKIVPRLEHEDYEQRVLNWCARRNPVRNHTHYIGLFSVPAGGYPRLSAKGRRNFRQLEHEVGPEFVHWRAIGIRSIHAGIFEFFGWLPELDT